MAITASSKTHSLRLLPGRALNRLSANRTINRALSTALPISCQVKWGITSKMTPARALKILRMPVPEMTSTGSQISARLATAGKKLFYAPLTGIEAIKGGLNRVRDYINFDGPFFGMELAFEAAGASALKGKRATSSILFFEGNSGEGKGGKKLSLTDDTTTEEVFAAVYPKDVKRADILRQLAEIEGAMDALENSGLTLEREIERSALFSEYILGLAEKKEELLNKLAELGPFEGDAQELTNLRAEVIERKSTIEQLREEMKRADKEREAHVKAREEAERSRDDIQKRFDELLKVFSGSDLGKANAEIESLTERLTAAEAAHKDLNDKFEKAKPLLDQSEAFRDDFEEILRALTAQYPEQIDSKNLATELGIQIIDIIIPHMKELKELRELRDKSLVDLGKHAESIKSAIASIQDSFRAQIEQLEHTNLAKNKSLEEARQSAAEINEELLALRQIHDAYNELTAILTGFGSKLDKARRGRLSMSEIKATAVGLQSILEQIDTVPGSEALIPELLDKMVYRLIELTLKEEMIKETANLTKELLRICREKGINLSEISVVKGETDAKKGLEELLERLDEAFDFEGQAPSKESGDNGKDKP